MKCDFTYIRRIGQCKVLNKLKKNELQDHRKRVLEALDLSYYNNIGLFKLDLLYFLRTESKIIYKYNNLAHKLKEAGKCHIHIVD
jgi:hypothetical protein